MKKKMLISGGSGFVGKSLFDFFKNDYEVIILKREETSSVNLLSSMIDSNTIIINLSGAPILSRWTNPYKEELFNSRINTTKNIVKSIEDSDEKPLLFISTSAIGIYDNEKTYTEENTNYSNDFLSNLCQKWEEEANKAKDLGIRTSIFRFGVVLGKNGGALEKMLPPFKLGLGGVIGEGSQAFSFIHIEDLLNAYKFLIENKESEGTFNLVSPEPTTNKGLTKALGKTLNRPTFLPLPNFILEIIFGEGSKVLTDGQSILPKRLLDLGFHFNFKNINDCIQNLIKK